MTELKRSHWVFVIVFSGWILLLVATFLAGVGENNTASRVTLDIGYSCLAVLSILLVKKEPDRGRKFVFLTFAVLSITEGVAWPIYNIILNGPLSRLYPNLYYYVYLYSCIYYFFWLNLIVLFLIIAVTAKAYVRKEYVIGFAVTVVACVMLYFPYLQDPRYVVKRPDVVDYRLVEKAVLRMREIGDTTLNSASISRNVELFHDLPGGAKVEVIGRQKEERIVFLMKYLRDNNVMGLALAPLYRSFAYHGFVLAFILVVCGIWWYFNGPPTSAYLEKIAWVLVPYCLLEGIHHLIFSSIVNPDSFAFTAAVGVYFSLGLLMGLAALFGLRLRFIHSVEGNYYERRLLMDPSSITRWRDAFDNWVLREFMNPGELDRRFLTRRRNEEP